MTLLLSFIILGSIESVYATTEAPSIEDTMRDKENTVKINILDQATKNEDNELVTESITEHENKISSMNQNQKVNINKNHPENINFQFKSDMDDNWYEVNLKLPLETKQTDVVNDVILQENISNNYSITNEIFDGGIRTSFLIENDNAPKEYPIHFDLPEGSYLRFAKTINPDTNKEETDGSIEIINKNGDILGAIGSAWARDFYGKEVKTYYRIENQSTLVQVVEHDNNLCKYPIVADPTAQYRKWFSKTKWVKKSKGWTLAVYRTGQLVTDATQRGKLASVANASWKTLYAQDKNDKHWKHTGGMKHQYICHVYYARPKAPWNLDVWRPNVSYAQTVAKACNP